MIDFQEWIDKGLKWFIWIFIAGISIFVAYIIISQMIKVTLKFIGG